MVESHAVEQWDSPLSFDATLVILEGGLRPLEAMLATILYTNEPNN